MTDGVWSGGTPQVASVARRAVMQLTKDEASYRHHMTESLQHTRQVLVPDG